MTMQKAREEIAETLWRAEYRRATGRERSVEWDSGVADADKDSYRYLADALTAALPLQAQEPAEGMVEADASMLICAVDAAIAAIEAGSTSAPVMECLKAARAQFLGARAALRASAPGGWQDPTQAEIQAVLNEFSRWGLGGLNLPDGLIVAALNRARQAAPVIADKYGEKK